MTTLTLALLAAVLAAQAGHPQRLVAADRTATIHGRVTDKSTGRPIARAVVRLARDGGAERQTTTTDDAGEFRFAGLEPGRFSGLVEAGRFRGTHQSSNLATVSGRYRPIEVKAGDVMEVNVALERTVAINVRVTDEWGDPLSGLAVSARAPGTGRDLLIPLRTTDDLGNIRLFGLRPGPHVVCAQAPMHGRSAHPEISSRPEALLRTCFPSADEASAEIVRLEGSDRDVEIVMRRGRVATISGRVIDASGAPVTKALLALTQMATNGSRSIGSHLEPGGSFRLVSVQPGDYAIEVTVGGPDRPEERRPVESAFVPLHVDGTDVEDLVIFLRRGVDVHGRVTLEDPSATLPPSPGSGLMPTARLVDDRSRGRGSAKTAIVRRDRTFTLEGAFGRRVIGLANVPRGWFVKAVRYDGRDVLDEAVEFKAANGPSLEVVLSNRGAYLSGRVTDERGNPVPRARLFAIPADVPLPPWLHRGTTSASAAGDFRLGPLRGGEYFIVALPSSAPMLQMGQWERVTRLTSVADRVTLGDLDERAIDLRLSVER